MKYTCIVYGNSEKVGPYVISVPKTFSNYNYVFLQCLNEDLICKFTTVCLFCLCMCMFFN